MKKTENLELNYNQKAVVENAKWVDAVLLSGFTFSGILVIAKSVGLNEFELYNLKIPVSISWVVLSVITIAHFYSMWLLNREIYRLWSKHSEEECQSVFQEIRATGGILVRGLTPRTKKGETVLGFQIYEMRLDDPSTWAAYVFAALLIAAIVPFSLFDIKKFLVMLFVAIVITALNWIIVSSWILALSELSIPHSKSIILRNKHNSPALSPVRATSAYYPKPKYYKSCSQVLIGLLVAIVAGALYAYVNSLGYGELLLKSLITLMGFLILPRALNGILRIRRFGKLLFILAYLVFTVLIIAGYIVWIS